MSEIISLHTLREAHAIDDTGGKLFVIPKIIIFQSKPTVDIITHGVGETTDTVNYKSKVCGYIASVYGDPVNEIRSRIEQIQHDNKEVNIVGYFNNRFKGRLVGISFDAYSFIDDENGPHTGWIKVIALDYRLEPIKDSTK